MYFIWLCLVMIGLYFHIQDLFKRNESCSESEVDDSKIEYIDGF